ncbi:MAG TPA: multicopper oxidase domain-containing protein [Patescibacteria group bacterium]|nr:multicopper oxidase domain-containing protein [Patescibacteria group bacterium]
MRRFAALITTFAAIAVLVGCTPTVKAEAPWTYPPAVADPAGAPSTSTPGGVLGTIKISAADLSFSPSMITVAEAGAYKVELTNTGAIQHNVTFADGTVVVAEAGQSASGVVTIPAAGMNFTCSIPGHAAAGMTGMVSVGSMPMGSSMPGMPGATATPGGSAAGAPVEDPNAPAYVLRDAAAPAVMPGTVHDIDLPIIETDITVAKGFVVHAWTFGGTVPGPVIRVHLGDTVRVHLTNQGSMSHSIDFHASETAMNHQMVEIKPGATWTYTFKANYAGVWMYHCGTAPALHHIANGMFGMVIVEPKGGLPKVDEEFALVQSEWYLGNQKEPVDYTKAASGAPAPDFVVFNGIANQYKDNPVQVTSGGRVRVFILDAGPSIDSSFHVVGTIFDTVIKEGVALRPGNAGGYGAQAVDLSPAQAAIIEFSPVEDGMYPFVTHAFNFVVRGAIGIFSAGDGDPNN